MTAREAGWRQVLGLAGVIVVGVLALQLVSMFVPVVGDVLGAYPTVIVVLAVVTVVLVALALRRSPRA
jgi:Na+/melibiose symporter-like transporter